MNTRALSVRGLAAAFVALAASVIHAPCSEAGVVCEQVGGNPGEEVTVHVEKLYPADGAIVPPTSGCGGIVNVTGTFFVDAPPPHFDFYIVIDSSGSRARR